MSKIFVNENPQGPAPRRDQRVGDQPRTDWRSLTAAPTRSIAATPKPRPREGFDDPATFVAGLVVLGLLVFALVTWWKQVALFAAVFVLFGLLARSPALAIGGALLLLLSAR
ncbi:MAG: hypothetical protein JSS04_11620 [Proteobacteria bacterium]|nr:hypothetical protein [Pseudomonadota bacterium]